MDVGFLSAHNPFDKRQFSGSLFYMRQALEARSDISLRVLGGHRPPDLSLTGRILARLRPPQVVTANKIDDAELDFIVAPVASGLIANLAGRLSTPILLVTDSTPKFLREFYNMELPESRDRQEALALNEASLVVYSSEYMLSRALYEFEEINPSKFSAFPFGINLDNIPTEIPEKRPINQLQLLFVGRDWHRKGGDIALATLDILVSRGVAAYLTIIGCNPDAARGRANVIVHSYLDKNNPKDLAMINSCYKQAHIFLLPTRGDCTPMVVAEANAWGCPVLITRTGGIPSLMNEGRNGMMIDYGASAENWADAVQALIFDPDRYSMLVRSSVQHCHENLTWSTWADNIVSLLTAQMKD